MLDFLREWGYVSVFIIFCPPPHGNRGSRILHRITFCNLKKYAYIWGKWIMCMISVFRSLRLTFFLTHWEFDETIMLTSAGVDYVRFGLIMLSGVLMASTSTNNGLILHMFPLSFMILILNSRFFLFFSFIFFFLSSFFLLSFREVLPPFPISNSSLMSFQTDFVLILICEYCIIFI